MKKVFVVFKSHFDMGYTDLAENVLQKYCTEMLEGVLDACEKSKDCPVGERYIWTMSAWLLSYVLESEYTSEENKKRLEECIKRRQVVWMQMPCTVHTEFSGIEELIRGFRYTEELSQKYDYWPCTAKMTDVPGHTTYLASLLHKQRVEFMHLGCNPCCTPPDVPRLFWWTGPDGGKVLTMYNKGQYGSSMLPPDDWKFPVWLALAQTNDNKGTLTYEKVQSLLKETREKMPDAEVVIGTLDDFYRELKKCDLSNLPVIAKDLADTWIHGTGTYPKEVSGIRKTRMELCEAEKLLTICRTQELITEEEFLNYTHKITDAYEAGLLFDEHTWGMAGLTSLGRERCFEKTEFRRTCTSPECRKAEQSWDEQRKHYTDMRDLTNEVLAFTTGHLADALLGGDEAIIFNGLTWNRDGVVKCPWTQEELEDHAIVDAVTGQKILCRNENGDILLNVKDIPAMGWKRLKREKSSCGALAECVCSAENVLENNRFYIEVDPKSGCLKSLYDKKRNIEYAQSEIPFGQYIYDVYGDQSEKRYISKYVYRYIAWVIDDLARINMPEQEDRTFLPGDFEVCSRREAGCSTLEWKCRIEDESVAEFGNARGVEFELKIYDDSDVIDFAVKLHDKQETPFPEGASVSLPFAINDCKIEINKIGCVIDPTADVMKDANNVLYCCENWVSIVGKDAGMLIIPYDTPLFGIGTKGIYEFSSEREAVTPHLYFNLFNTQWGTNFPQWIGGDLSFRYRFIPLSGSETTGDRQRMALEAMTPIVAQKRGVLTQGGRADIPESFIQCSSLRILAMQKRVEDHTILLRVINLEEESTKAKLRCVDKIEKIELLGEETECVKSPDGWFEFETAPFEIHTLRLKYAEKDNIMTGRDLVKRAIHFENPLRIPYNFNSEKCDLICCKPEQGNYDVLRKTAEENHGEKYLAGVFGENDDYAADIRMMAECGMDGIIVGDVSLKQQNDAELYKEMAAVAHECGIDVILHTNSVDIAGKYVEYGADAIWMDEPDMTGLEELSERLRGKVCFFCTLNVKTVLNSDREELFEYCDKLVRFLSTENGGFLAAVSCSEEHFVTENGVQNLEECFVTESLCRYKAKISMDTELHLASEKLVMLPGESRQMKQLNSVYKTNDWYTDDTDRKVIRIQDGVVTAEGLGEATAVITSDWGGSQTYVFRVEVKEKRDLQETGLALNRGEVRLNLHSMYDMPLYVQFGCYTEPSSSGNVTWTSSEPSVAAVGEDGRVHPVSVGETVISALHKDFPEVPVTCKVTVYENAPCSHFYYVSPMGSDENTGTEVSPFKTIQKARDVIRGLKELPDGGATVILEDGKYLQEEPIVFTPEDSGTESAPVVYRARNCGKAVITGEKAITGWKKAEVVPGLSEAAAGNVYVADVTPGWRFHDMYLNGVRQQNSRSVNTDIWREWPAFYGRVELERCNGQKGMCVRFEAGELDGLDGNEDVEIVVLPMQFWNMIAVLGEIDSKSNTAYLRSRVPSFMKKYFINKDVSGGTGEGWYNILNTLKYLDEPGEWCVDSKAGKVYFWPKNEESINQDEIVAAVPFELVRLQGDGVDSEFKNLVEYLTFDGISFQYTDRMSEDQMPEDWLIRNAENPDAAVFFDGTRHCGLYNCEVCHSGAYAVTVNNFAQNNEILHNNLTDLGSGGVQLLGYGVGTVDVNHHNIVQYNSVSGMGRAPYQHSPGFTVFGSGYNAIAYNSIKGAPYAGVSIVGTAYDAVCRKEEDRNRYTCVDAFGNKAHQYQIRFEELEMLPEEELDGGSKYFFSPATCAKKYQHSVNNVVEYNILDDYSLSMDDGGGLYAWSPGMGNTYAYNVLKEQLQGTRTWVFRLYLDDVVMGVTMEKNLCTGYFDATLDKSYLFAPYLNRWGIHGTDTNLRTVYPEKPDGYEEQRKKILDTVKHFTGDCLG